MRILGKEIIKAIQDAKAEELELRLEFECENCNHITHEDEMSDICIDDDKIIIVSIC